MKGHGGTGTGTGLRLLREALESPLRQRVANAGLGASVIVQDGRNAETNIGFDVAKEQMGDMFKLNIIDPVKVVRVALESAVSVSALMLTTEAVVAEIEEAAPAAPAGAPDMGMDF